jgi:hypothetical protein
MNVFLRSLAKTSYEASGAKRYVFLVAILHDEVK